MNLNEYQRLALRTSGAGHDRVKNGCLGLIGESGEIVDIVKKYMFQSGENPPFPKDKFINEIGDVLWYCAETVSGVGLDLKLIAETPENIHWCDACADLDLVNTVTAMTACACKVYYTFFGAEKGHGALYQLSGVYALLVHLCNLIGVTIDEVADANIEKLKKRYPDGFDPERSIHRPEYERKEQTESAPTHLFRKRNKAL